MTGPNKKTDIVEHELINNWVIPMQLFALKTAKGKESIPVIYIKANKHFLL